MCVGIWMRLFPVQKTPIGKWRERLQDKWSGNVIWIEKKECQGGERRVKPSKNPFEIPPFSHWLCVCVCPLEVSLSFCLQTPTPQNEWLHFGAAPASYTVICIQDAKSHHRHQSTRTRKRTLPWKWAPQSFGYRMPTFSRGYWLEGREKFFLILFTCASVELGREREGETKSNSLIHFPCLISTLSSAFLSLCVSVLSAQIRRPSLSWRHPPTHTHWLEGYSRNN